MVDRHTLLDILETLAEYLDELREYRKLPREKVVGDRQVQSAVRYALQTAVQSQTRSIWASELAGKQVIAVLLQPP